MLRCASRGFFNLPMQIRLPGYEFQLLGQQLDDERRDVVDAVPILIDSQSSVYIYLAVWSVGKNR